MSPAATRTPATPPIWRLLRKFGPQLATLRHPKLRDGDNVDHELTLPELMSLWQQSSEYVSALDAASWALKALDSSPADFADDIYWPA